MGAEGLRADAPGSDRHGLFVISEVMDQTQIPLLLEYTDILQVGARNMQNFNLLRELGKVRKPVLLKRGIAATIEEWLLSAEYILAGGNHEVILCERGIRTFENYTRNTLDISAIPLSRNSPIFPLWSIRRMARVAATRCLRWPGLLSQPERTDCWLRFIRIRRRRSAMVPRPCFPSNSRKLMKELGQIAPVLGRTSDEQPDRRQICSRCPQAVQRRPAPQASAM
jgi:3-deoxy-7-phosphoheptulonate synthase